MIYFVARLRMICVAMVLMVISANSQAAKDLLPSWNNTSAKQAIVDFVKSVTNPKSNDFVKPRNRIAVFDNDGTLWVEQPIYIQLAFINDRVKALAPKHPEWQTEQPFKALLEGDLKTLGELGMEGVLKMGLATHSGMTTNEFHKMVLKWLATAKHPRFDRHYTQLVYQPQLELLKFLRHNDFKTFIVSGGGIAFMRPWTQKVYGIPPEQVVGSSVVTEFKIKNGKPVIMRMPKLNFINDKEGKPVGINSHIGKRPIFAFGNSDGDLQMIQYTTGAKGKRLGLFLHHTDAEREYAYDRKSHVGKLDKVLDIASKNGWIIVDMKRDWNRVFPNPTMSGGHASH